MKQMLRNRKFDLYEPSLEERRRLYGKILNILQEQSCLNCSPPSCPSCPCGCLGAVLEPPLHTILGVRNTVEQLYEHSLEG
jgi:hypothetical protein